MKYTIQKTDNLSSRLIIEWTPNPDKALRPIVLRHCFDKDGCLDRINGAVLGFDRINPCALFLLVNVGDLISIGNKEIDGTSATWTHYQIGFTFEMNLIGNDGNILSSTEIRALIPANADWFHQPPGCDDSLRDFISDTNHPAWLVQILERQKQKWRKKKLSKYYHLVPSETSLEEIDRIMKLTPGAAVRFFYPLLTKKQIRRCIRRDLKTAAVYSLDLMSPEHLQLACLRWPTLLLKTHASILPENRLMQCVRLDPMEGFRIRNKVAPELHARILAVSCGLPFSLFCNGDLSGLPLEISTSFHNFPIRWFEAHGHNFYFLFKTLERHGRMRINQELIDFLIQTLPPSQIQDIYQFISENI